jgi:hypothetical protein
MGKSTCVRSVLVALGLEGTLTTSQTDLPLAPAMKSIIEGDRGINDVIESSVALELENRSGERITVERAIRSSRNVHLITVHPGPRLTLPRSTPARSQDYYVGRPGAATREHGFHQFLAQFLGWDLPTVQTFDGRDCPLYLQCIFPFLIVEQMRGWSTIQPPIPSHFKIKEVHKRVVEFLRSMDAHKIALRRFELLSERNQVEAEWTSVIRRASAIAEAVQGVVQSLPAKPATSWPGTFEPTILVPERSDWVAIEEKLARQEREHARLVGEEIPKVYEIASTAAADLDDSEQLLNDREALFVGRNLKVSRFRGPK